HREGSAPPRAPGGAARGDPGLPRRPGTHRARDRRLLLDQGARDALPRVQGPEGAGGRASGRDRPAAPPRRGLRAWPARPTWTLREAEERCGVSRSTLKRRLAAGDFPNAYKTSQGQWRVPVNDLIAAGYQPDAVDWGEEQEEPAPATTPPDRVTVNRPGFVRGSQVPRRRVSVRGGCESKCRWEERGVGSVWEARVVAEH